jgi:hypothetical protein
VTPEVLEHFKKLGVKNPEQFIQNAQQQREQDIQKQLQRQKMRRLAEKAQEHPEILESVRKLFEEMPGKKSSETDLGQLDKGTERLAQIDKQAQTLQAVVEKAKENPEFGQRVRELLEEKRRKLDEPCMQDSFPASSVRGEVAPVEGGGTVLQVLSDLGTTNICSDSVSSVQFGRIISYTCPPDCTPSTGGSATESTPAESFIPGVPSTIDQYATSKGSATDRLYCIQTDANGNETPVAPSSTLYIVWPQGIQKGSTIRGQSKPYYPPNS